MGEGRQGKSSHCPSLERVLREGVYNPTPCLSPVKKGMWRECRTKLPTGNAEETKDAENHNLSLAGADRTCRSPLGVPTILNQTECHTSPLKGEKWLKRKGAGLRK